MTKYSIKTIICLSILSGGNAFAFDMAQFQQMMQQKIQAAQMNAGMQQTPYSFACQARS